MKKKIIAKIRYIKGIIFGTSAIPNDINGFMGALSNIDDAKLSEYERSLYAYKMAEKYVDYPHHSNTLKKVIYTFMFPFVYFGISRKNLGLDIENKRVVYYCVSNNRGILPEKYKFLPDLQTVSMGEGMMLDKEAKEILKNSFKVSRGKLYFIMEEMLALANYSYICNKYQPNEIITSYESFYANSVLTSYCHKKNIVHTNFMHGEKLLSPFNVLGNFDNMYVWDEHYLRLFQRLKYRTNNFIIENPWKENQLPSPTGLVDYTFYLNLENEKSLHFIVDIAQRLNASGKTVRIRLHPSQIKEERLKRIIPKSMYDNDIKDIFQSIANADYVVSKYSTVLFQAYSKGKKIVIDDISNPEEFRKLKQLDYIMIEKEHLLLSSIVSEEGITC